MKKKLIIGSVIPIVLIIGAAVWFVTFEPIQVLPRIRLAPGYLLVNQDGDTVTSEDARGDIVLYNFAYTNCGEECDEMNETMIEIQDRLDEVDAADTDIKFVTISFDPERDDPEVLRDYAAELGADTEQWQFFTGEPGHIENVVKAGFEAYFQEGSDDSFSFAPMYVLVDGWGVIRGEYRYATVTSDADKIVRQLGVLGEEVRNSHGAAALAYEAAHFFLCYP